MLSHNDFQQVYYHSAEGVIALDTNGCIVYANPNAVSNFFAGVSYLGEKAADFFTGPHNSALNDVEFTLTINHNPVTVLVSSSDFTDHEQALTYWFIRNITPLKKQEHLLAYLNTASEELSGARDTKGALERISKLIVPKFATWFSIDLIKDGKLEELVLAHEDSGMIEWARKYRAMYPTDLDSDNGTARVARTGQSAFFPVINEEMVRASVTDSGQLQTFCVSIYSRLL